MQARHSGVPQKALLAARIPFQWLLKHERMNMLTGKPERKGMKSKARGKAKKILGVEKRRELVRERIEMGMTYREIGREIGCSAATVTLDFKAIKEMWREEHVHQIGDMIALEAARLDIILKAIMPQVKGSHVVETDGIKTDIDVPVGVQHDAIELVLKTLDRRLKLYGLDSKALLEQLSNILEPTDEERVRKEVGRVADGLRELEAIANQYRGGSVSGKTAGDNGKPPAIN